MDNEAVQIRRAQLADFPGISRLMDDLHQMHVQARPDIYRPLQPRLGEKEYAEWFTTDQRYVYAAEHVETGELIGFSSAQFSIIQDHALFSDRRMLYIHELIVDAAYRGHGTGRKLMQAILELGKELQVEHMELTVSAFNAQAVAFYEQMGLQARSCRMEYKF